MSFPVLPYGRQSIDETDIEGVVAVLKSDWLTTGPKVDAFEEKFVELLGVDHAVAVSSGTAALHCAMHALGIGPGDEVIVPPLTFAATANCVVFQGGVPVFADVDPKTLLLDPVQVARKISHKTKAIIAVDYAGQPCDYDALGSIAKSKSIPIVADACHSLGALYKGRTVGTLADISVFSFHPVKHITTGEGGMVVTANTEWAQRIRRFRNHGISSDFKQRSHEGSWFYEMVDLGFNYRLTDFQSALGISQLKKLPDFITRRQAIAAHYNQALASVSGVSPIVVQPEVSHAYHLYVVNIESEKAGISRAEMFSALRAKGIGVNVHYVPVHLHPYYRKRFGTMPGLCPVAEAAYDHLLSLPIFPVMIDEDAQHVVSCFKEVLAERYYKPSQKIDGSNLANP